MLSSAAASLRLKAAEASSKNSRTACSSPPDLGEAGREFWPRQRAKAARAVRAASVIRFTSVSLLSYLSRLQILERCSASPRLRRAALERRAVPNPYRRGQRRRAPRRGVRSRRRRRSARLRLTQWLRDGAL